MERLRNVRDVSLRAVAPLRRRKLCIVTGNCQAEALRGLLDLSPGFASEYVTVPIPAVYRISSRDTRAVGRLVARANLYVAHPVRDNYRGLQLGNEQMAAALPAGARHLRVPPIYYEGTLPYQVNVHVAGQDVAVPAPLTEYHDLRVLAAAAAKLPLNEAASWFETATAPRDALVGLATESARTLGERDARVDLPVSDAFLALTQREKTLHSVNHPTLKALALVADSILNELGVGTVERLPDFDPLGVRTAPIESHIVSALGLEVRPEQAWKIHGSDVPWKQVLATHLDFYQREPAVLRCALAEHSERLEKFGLNGI